LVRKEINPHKISLELNEKGNGKFLCGKYVDNLDYSGLGSDVNIVKNIVVKINFKCSNCQ